MTQYCRPQPNCSIARTLELVGDRWTFLVLREAHNGVTRFASFRELLGIAPNVLTWRLAGLVDAGILERRSYQDEGSRARWSYHLTPRGEDLKVVLGALQQWGDQHLPRNEGPTVRRLDNRTDEELAVGFVDVSGRTVPGEEVVFVPVAGGPADRGDWR